MQSCLIGKDQRPICRDQPWHCISHPHATAGYLAYQQAFDRDGLDILHLAKAKFNCGSAGPTTGGLDFKGLGYGPDCISLLSLFCFHEIRCKQEPIAAPTMAPHALQDTYDSTGYTPSIDNYAEILPYLRVHGSVQASLPTTPVLSSNDVSIRFTAGESKSEHFWHLSPHEIQDIEASMKFFQCKLP